MQVHYFPSSWKEDEPSSSGGSAEMFLWAERPNATKGTQSCLEILPADSLGAALKYREVYDPRWTPAIRGRYRGVVTFRLVSKPKSARVHRWIA